MLPEIDPVPWQEACWVAFAKTRSPEHHPPLYWLGRALDELGRGAGGGIEGLAARLIALHGPTACEGWSEADQRVQDALTTACAEAWATEHLGPVALVGEDVEPILYVASLDAHVAARRLWPVRTMEQLLGQAAGAVEAAARSLPASKGRIVYVDVPLNMFGWSQDVGYAAPSTEPLRAVLKHVAAEHHVGYVLTRPFQWKWPLESWY